MEILQEVWDNTWRVNPALTRGSCSDPELVLCFGARELVSDPRCIQRLRERFGNAQLLAASTAGEIAGPHVLDDTCSVTALKLQRCHSSATRVQLRGGDSEQAGRALARAMAGPELKHVLVFSDGIKVNGSDLVRGMSAELQPRVTITGGLSGDGARFERTIVCLNELDLTEGAVAIGLYGSALRVACGSLGGWDAFGPERLITRSQGNVLYEVDGKPALDLYEQYLGDHAAELPSSGLLFPMTVRERREDTGVVRTILSVDRQARSLTFAGDVPNGHYARLMRANFDRLVDGAAGAASTARGASLLGETPELALLISCVGRKLVLKQRIEEEVEAVERVLGADAVMCGFYSYGEISPFTPDARCELHNQTMTVTTLSEI